MKTRSDNHTRRLDDVGRVCVPKPMRKHLDVKNHDKLEFKYANGINALILTKAADTPK